MKTSLTSLGTDRYSIVENIYKLSRDSVYAYNWYISGPALCGLPDPIIDRILTLSRTLASWSTGRCYQTRLLLVAFATIM